MLVISFRPPCFLCIRSYYTRTARYTYLYVLENPHTYLVCGRLQVDVASLARQRALVTQEEAVLARRAIVVCVLLAQDLVQLVVVARVREVAQIGAQQLQLTTQNTQRVTNVTKHTKS